MVDVTDGFAFEARAGSPSAFGDLYDRVSPVLLAWARIRTGGSMRKLLDPEDLLHEVWWRALESFPRFDPERGSFRTWTFGIANKTFSHLLRELPKNGGVSGRDARFQELPSQLQDQVTSISAAVRRKDRIGDLADTINELAPADRSLFIHCGLEGMALKDAGAMLGISENAAKKRWQRLRDRLARFPIVQELLAP